MTFEMPCINHHMKEPISGCYHRKFRNNIGKLSRRSAATMTFMLSLMMCLCALNSHLSMLVDAFSSWTGQQRIILQRNKSDLSTGPLLQSFCFSLSRGSSERKRSKHTSSLICRSTISDETATTIFQINGVANGALNNGVSNGAALNGVTLNGVVNGVSSNCVSLYGLHVKNRNGQTGKSNHVIDKESSEEDVPLPTVNGGYSHTSASKAKISAANKGKIPWNKGKTRSEEVKARIAEGVRRRNRERFLEKLAAEGITEEEFNKRKKEERRRKDAERRARKTAKGGYIPTEETKKKISRILKTKYAKGEIRRSPRDPSSIRKGFKHSEETKRKIRESLKRKWAEDTEYRDLMTNKTVASGALGRSIRKRIADTLKRKWEDPEFRSLMMEKFKNRKKNSGSRDKAHREKISAAMKRKWMDEEYRKRATEGMAKGREKLELVKPAQPKMSRVKKVTSANKGDITTVQPLTKVPEKKTKTAVKRKKTTSSAEKKSAAKDNEVSLTAAEPITTVSNKHAVKQSPKASEPEPDGSIMRLREERRDLYDLLYGDEDDGECHRNGEAATPMLASLSKGSEIMEDSDLLGSGGLLSGSSMASLLEDDDDLDDFDPYGLSNY